MIRILRAGFVMLLVVIPIPIGQLFYRLFDPRRKNEAAQIIKKEEPD